MTPDSPDPIDVNLTAERLLAEVLALWEAMFVGDYCPVCSSPTSECEHSSDCLYALIKHRLKLRSAPTGAATPPQPTAELLRLIALAQRGAYDIHCRGYNIDRGEHVGSNDGWGAFLVCPHPDCVLVRQPASPTPTEGALDLDEPLHTGDDERLDRLIDIHGFLEELEGEDAPTGAQLADNIASALESCDQLSVLLIRTIKRERLRAAHGGQSV